MESPASVSPPRHLDSGNPGDRPSPSVDSKVLTPASAHAIPVEKPAWASPEFESIYDEYSRQIFYLALRFLSDPTQAEDATHDVFLKAYRKLGEFRGEAALRTWLYRITINHCRNLLQTWHRRNMVSNADDSVWESAVAASGNPLHVLETKELGQRIQRTLDALPEEYRLLLLLRADERLSYEDVAALTEQSADAVRGKLHRARKAFVAHFQKTA